MSPHDAAPTDVDVRPRRAARVAAAVATTAVTLLSAGASPAGAGIGDNARPSNDQYSHAASWVAAAGGGSGGQGGSNRCTLPPPDEAMPAHYEWNSYETGGGLWSVYLNCVADGQNVPSNGEDFDFPENWDVVWYEQGVRPADPQDMAAEALAALRPPEAAISTDPDPGLASLVGIETFFWLEEGAYAHMETTVSDGPVVGGGPLLSVRVWADPLPGREVTWDTGDGTMVCANAGLPQGSCGHTYNRSSRGAGATDANGRPAFTVTATYGYTGGYETYVMGELLDSGTLDVIERTSEAVLAVNEAQAINTNGRG
jgi:hypothetical protein